MHPRKKSAPEGTTVASRKLRELASTGSLLPLGRGEVTAGRKQACAEYEHTPKFCQQNLSVDKAAHSASSQIALRLRWDLSEAMSSLQHSYRYSLL